MKNEITIYLMRHGLDNEIFIGGWSEGGLIEKGINQTELAKEYIIKNIKEIKTIYHSGLKRTIETAEIINDTLKLPMFFLKEIKELNKGKLNGMNANLAKTMYPEYFPNPLVNQKYPEGESLKDLYNRVKVFLKNIDKYDKSLLITHRGFINMLYFILNDIEINYDKNQFDVVHGSIHELKFCKIKRIF